MEKDAGEEFFTGSNKQGFDFYSGYLQYKNEHSWVQNIVIGDYQIQTGQGLLVWSGYSLGKTASINNLCRRSNKIKGNISAQENRLLRGGALTIGRNRFSCTAYVSGIHIDAVLADSNKGDTKFIYFVETGYHNTPNELEKENSIFLKTTGASVCFNSHKLKCGLNSVYTSLSKSLDESELLYKKLSFSGKALTGFSADYHYLAGITQFFGETAISNNNFATLNGLMLYFKPGINIGAIYRWYQPGYYSYYANAFSEGSNVGNENGFFLIGEFNFSDNRLKVYGDIFSFPWLKYRVNAPSDGNELSIEAGRKLQQADISFSYKRCEKPQNNSTGNHVEDIRSFITEKYRLNGTCLIGDKISLQNRIELSQAAFRGSNKEYGFLILQDMVWHNLPGTVEFSVRVGYYHIDDYDARIYAYERDVLYANSTLLCYGKGWRFSGLIKWQPAELFTFWLHIGSSVYPGEEFTGSGLNTINTNHRTEIKIESVIRF
jgi:hypothetical protein